MQLLRKIAAPISLIYAFVVYFRNFLFDRGIFKSQSFKTTTICVGNLSAGGTGKTPMIEFLIKGLQSQFNIAVLSRGYGRKSKGFLLASAEVSVEQIGDEPYQIYQKFPSISLAVDGDRRNGISLLEEKVQPDVILLDDAFQHRKVKPSFNILLTAYGNLYINDWYLPTGSLRDAKNQSKRADVVIVTKCPKELTANNQIEIKTQLRLNSKQALFFATLVYEDMLQGLHDKIALDTLKDKRVTLVTGIANPIPLLNYLQEKGIVFEHLQFTDHHFFTAEEIEIFNTKEMVLTTEKDYVRLKGKVSSMYYIGVRHKLLNKDNEALLQRVRHAIG
ncbi:tetraacyldisaccharide 4'-kinase [Cellulophaga sp. F20128]|uniref:tetraacyldisaccharide 4'-kinase n=1 Tax=Cellulophaga sp. F20128 TaxID=2926413 RepID=UPI001FF216DA|nr:tetraacyldisaccharide 4'-kinase [Cellulophaga sp. F20128]MCK0158455.1 tetraacyldisaccharide 4'-kinase [Cellulophaga sp. F20128]